MKTIQIKCVKIIIKNLMLNLELENMLEKMILEIYNILIILKKEV